MPLNSSTAGTGAAAELLAHWMQRIARASRRCYTPGEVQGLLQGLLHEESCWWGRGPSGALPAEPGLPGSRAAVHNTVLSACDTLSSFQRQVHAIIQQSTPHKGQVPPRG